MEADWTLDGLTALVYAIPKVMLGLPRDAPPNPELKVAQRTFFKALYQLLVASDTGPRLPTLMLSIGPERTRELLVGEPGGLANVAGQAWSDAAPPRTSRSGA